MDTLVLNSIFSEKAKFLGIGFHKVRNLGQFSVTITQSIENPEDLFRVVTYIVMFANTSLSLFVRFKTQDFERELSMETIDDAASAN